MTNEMIKSYSKHFGLNEKKVQRAVAVAKAVAKEWKKRLGEMSEEEYDIVEGTLIKQLAK
jgi:hypothetical protein